MKIGIDARPVSKRRTGIGNYVYNLVRLLPSCTPRHDYLLYSNKELKSQFPGESIQRRTDSRFGWCPGSLWLSTRCGSLIRSDQVNVFWATSPLLPLGIPAGVLKIVTVYDLVWLRHPETMSRYNLYVHRMRAQRSIATADLIIAISCSTRDEVVRSLGVPACKIRVVYAAPSEKYKLQDPLAAARYISNKYQLPSRYLATVGTVEPRKNLGVLIEALGILKSKKQLDCPLLVVGASGWKNSCLFRAITSAGLTEQDIRFLGYLPDDDMPSLYAGAQLFLFPSLYEGFGMPPLEAMACGTPVIASDSQCMPETLGNAATFVPAQSPEMFATAILNALSDEKLRGKKRAEGIRQAQQFRWEESAKQLVDLLQEPLCQSQVR